MAILSEFTGFCASALVLATFTMKDMRMLRMVAVFSNVAFITYGTLEWLPPVFGLHVLLLPLNLLRLWEMHTGATVPVMFRQMLAGVWTVRLQPETMTAHLAN